VREHAVDVVRVGVGLRRAGGGARAAIRWRSRAAGATKSKSMVVRARRAVARQSWNEVGRQKSNAALIVMPRTIVAGVVAAVADSVALNIYATS
jgi:hypothetical protein